MFSKKLFIILISITLVSCSHFIDLEHETEYHVLDFTKYSNDNFLITTESFNKEYESIGIISVTISPAITKSLVENPEKYKAYINGMGGVYYFEKISYEHAIDSMYYLAKRMGANAIINLTLESTVKYYYNVHEYHDLSVSGFAIRRK